MEDSLKELANYRMERSEEMLLAADENLRLGQLRTSLNRSYYAIFHAMRAANILEGFDSSKHSGVIAYFNKNYLKDNKLEKGLARIIKDSSYLREKSDYDDFYIASKEDAENQLENAKIFVAEVKEFIGKRNSEFKEASWESTK